MSEKLKGLDEKYDSVLKTVQGVAKDQKTTSTELGNVVVRVKALEDNTDDVRKLRIDLDDLLEKYERLLLKFEGTETKAREENQTLTDKLIAAEQRISDCEDKDNTTEVKALRKEIETLKHVSSDIIGRSKRSNVRVINVKEGSEAGDIYHFLDELLRYVLDLGEGAEGPEIDRGHRDPRPLPDPGEPPRTIYVQLLRWRDRERVRKAVANKELSWGGTRFYIRTDDSPKVQRLKAAYNGIVAKIKDQGHRFGVTHTGKLIITIDGEKLVYDTPTEAETDLRIRLPTLF